MCMSSVVQCGSKIGHHKDMLLRTTGRLCATNLLISLGSIINMQNLLFYIV